MEKRKHKKKKPDSPMLAETRALVKEGYSLKKAMEIAGYSPTTIQKKASEYLKKLDLNELRKGLKIQTALSSYKAFKILDQQMDEADKSTDKIKAADAVLRSGKTFLTREPGDTVITFQLQTIQGKNIVLNSSSKLDVIDINSEEGEEDKS